MATENDTSVRVRVEIPKGSRNKYEVDGETGDIELDRRLHASVNYPTDYGYVEGTIGEDGDALDAMVCVSEPTFPGCVIRARPIAVLRMRKEGERNDKLLCVPFSDPAWNGYQDVDELPEDLGTEILHFFRSYTALEPHEWTVEGWAPSGEALDTLEQAQRRHAEERQ